MDRFGIDKPDLRFGLELVELTAVFAGDRVQGVRRRPRPSRRSGCRAARPTTAATSSTPSPTGPSSSAPRAWCGCRSATAARSTAPSPSSSPTTSRPRSWRPPAREAGDLLLLVADEWHTDLRGARHAPQRPRPPAGARGPVPLRVGRRLPDVRRAATTPGTPSRRTTRSPGRTPTTSTGSSPTRCRCARKAYDLVLNGWELGSGSIRIHEPDLQQRIFDLLGIGEEEAERRFGFFLTPFRYGAPPHGGFAFGIDRLVAILAGEENIREVIAFPKPQSGIDPMTGAPTAGRRPPARRPRPPRPPAQGLTAPASLEPPCGAVDADVGQRPERGDDVRDHRPSAAHDVVQVKRSTVQPRATSSFCATCGRDVRTRPRDGVGRESVDRRTIRCDDRGCDQPAGSRRMPTDTSRRRSIDAGPTASRPERWDDAWPSDDSCAASTRCCQVIGAPATRQTRGWPGASRPLRTHRSFGAGPGSSMACDEVIEPALRRRRGRSTLRGRVHEVAP